MANKQVKRPDANGVLNVAKAAGMTSHDVVASVRRIVGQRRVGHAGTLDPLATGVLVVCLGKATRLVDYLVEGAKVYLGTIRLGTVTDTDDTEGAVTAESPVPDLDIAQIERVLDDFRGEIQQVPPMYSALKRQGRPLYELARQGVVVERPARSITVEQLTLVAFDGRDLVVRVVCSKGTYIRSLARDIGEALGCGGHLLQLTREAVGAMRLGEAVSLDTLAQDGWQRHLRSMADALAGLMPCVAVDSTLADDLGHGRAVSLPDAVVDGLCYAVDGEGQVLAVLRREANSGDWQPDKVFVDS